MKLSSVVLSLVAVFILCVARPVPASADSGHARIVRLSVVQGDVRFAREFHGDSLTDTKAVWETAPLNLPIREGYVLSTGSGRAEVEFESGAMAFLGDNTVVEFYDLSLSEGGRITRLVLRQGTGSFFVSPITGDYFSVTGGDFTVETTSRATFRVENFDDGSTVRVSKGDVGVIRNDKTTPLGKGQELTVRAGDPKDKFEISRVSATDDFDKWVSGRIDSTVVATNSSAQYVNSAGYISGYADLYTYGSWFSLPGYGYGWRPFGVGLGWSPFDYGSWYFDQGLGWSFVGSSPWGWLPYHYGGWLFSPGYGWVWTPSGFYGGGSGRPVGYRPVTAVFVRSGGTLGVVPAHPADAHGKTPLNLQQGLYQVQGNSVGKTLAAGGAEKWSVVKQAPRETFTTNLIAASAPAHVSRSVTPDIGGLRPSRSSLAFDSGSHRFVKNSGSMTRGGEITAASSMKMNRNTPNVPQTTVRNATARPAGPIRPSIAPPPARGTTMGAARSSSGTWNAGGRGSAVSGATSRASAPAPVASGGRAH